MLRIHFEELYLNMIIQLSIFNQLKITLFILTSFERFYNIKTLTMSTESKSNKTSIQFGLKI